MFQWNKILDCHVYYCPPSTPLTYSTGIYLYKLAWHKGKVIWVTYLFNYNSLLYNIVYHYQICQHYTFYKVIDTINIIIHQPWTFHHKPHLLCYSINQLSSSIVMRTFVALATQTKWLLPSHRVQFIITALTLKKKHCIKPFQVLFGLYYRLNVFCPFSVSMVLQS